MRDSAGIEIAEHPADAFDRGPLITMDTVPFFEFGGESAEIEMSRAAWPRILPHGRLAMYAEGTVYIIGMDGAVVERIGRQGSGPGEFRYASITYGRGDTLVVEDIPNARVSYVVSGKGAADADSQVARYRRMIADGRFPNAADTVEMLAGIRRRPVADSLGAIGGFLRAPDDILWVRDGGYVAADSEWGYAAVRPDGTLLGRIVGSGRNKIVAFGSGVAVLRAEDDDGFVAYRVHRLNMP